MMTINIKEAQRRMFNPYRRPARRRLCALLVSLVLLVSVGAEELTLTVSTDKERYEVDEIIVGRLEASGGSPPYSYNYFVYDGPKRLWAAEGWWTKPSVEFSLSYGGTYDVKAIVTDEAGQTASAAGTIHVNPGKILAVAHSFLSSDKVKPGDSVTATWEAEGGTPPYLYDVEWRVGQFDGVTGKIGQQKVNVLATTDTFTSGEEGSGYFQVKVTDAQGNTATQEEFFSVVLPEHAEPMAVGLTLDKASVAVGQPITGSAAVTGGKPPYRYEWRWELADENGGMNREFGIPIEDGRSKLTPLYGKAGLVYVVVTDSVGQQAFSDLIDFSVTAVEASEPPMPTQHDSLPGDADGNDVVDLLDLLTIIDHIVSGSPLPAQDRADANADTKVDLMDLLWIIDMIVGG